MLRRENYFSLLFDLMFRNWSTHWDMKLVIVLQLLLIFGLLHFLLIQLRRQKNGRALR